MRSSPVRSILAAVSVAASFLLAVPATMAAGQAPVVSAIDFGVAAESYHPSADRAAAAPNHPPIDQVPPKPMADNPDWSLGRLASSGPGQAVSYNAVTRLERLTPLAAAPASSGIVTGGGYAGVDGGGGNEAWTATMGLMSLIGNPQRASFPYSMNVKLLMRFGADYFVCSGSMRDSNVVLTAGHCVNNGGGGAWADEIWVYPAWDGNGSLFGPPSIVNHYGWAHSTNLASVQGWTVSGDFNFDIGAIALDRSVGFLTGWFGWAADGSCAFATSTTYNSASYPAESCGGGLHTGTNMYFWAGAFNSCPNTNRLRLSTTGGCLGAVWGGMSGSGAYFVDGLGNRVTHAVTSTSNRSTFAEYTRQFQSWVDYLNGTFDPQSQGANFNLQPLRVSGPATFTAGVSTTGVSHVAADTSTAGQNGNYTFRVYLSTNDEVSTSDTLLSTQGYAFNFQPNSAATINMAAITIPANTPPGTYYLGVIYDNATDGNTADNDTDGWDALQITVLPPAPAITMKVNGIHPTPPAVVNTAGPYNLTISIAPTTFAGAVDHYWLIVVNGTFYWVTSTGVSTTPAPFMTGPVPAWTDHPLLSLNLPHGVSITSAYFMTIGGSLWSLDYVTAVTPASSASPTH